MAKRIILIGSALVIALVVIVVVTLFSKLDSLVASAIAHAGSHVTGTEVFVGGVDIGIKEGRGAVTQLAVSNPSGFSDHDAFRLEEISIDLDVESLRSANPIIIDLLHVSTPEILFELDAKGQSNIDVIRKHAESISSRAGNDNDGRESTPILIRSIRFDEGRIIGDASAAGLEGFEVTVPSFTLSDVGAPNGTSPDRIGKIIVATLARKSAEAVAREKGGEVLKEKLEKSLADKAKSLFD